MPRWINKVAVVTGASSVVGIGIVQELLNKTHLNVVGLAKYSLPLEESKEQLPVSQQSKLTILPCDICDPNSVRKAFAKIFSKYGGVDVLVNNDNILVEDNLSTGNVDNIQRCLQTNVMGVMYCMQEATKSMRERDVDGHIVLVNCVIVHDELPTILPGQPTNNAFVTPKFAVGAIAELYRDEFERMEANIKVTTISPGERYLPPNNRKDEGVSLSPDDISKAVLYAISAPRHTHVNDIIIKPVAGIL